MPRTRSHWARKDNKENDKRYKHIKQSVCNFIKDMWKYWDEKYGEKEVNEQLVLKDKAMVKCVQILKWYAFEYDEIFSKKGNIPSRSWKAYKAKDVKKEWKCIHLTVKEIVNSVNKEKEKEIAMDKETTNDVNAEVTNNENQEEEAKTEIKPNTNQWIEWTPTQRADPKESDADKNKSSQTDQQKAEKEKLIKVMDVKMHHEAISSFKALSSEKEKDLEKEKFEKKQDLPATHETDKSMSESIAQKVGDAVKNKKNGKKVWKKKESKKKSKIKKKKKGKERKKASENGSDPLNWDKIWNSQATHWIVFSAVVILPVVFIRLWMMSSTNGE